MIGDKKVLVVVTARGGSKGIPLKNVKPLLGKPLFIWSVLAGLQSKYVDKTVVSSNCPEVYKCFHNFNIETNEEYTESNKLKFIQRPDELSGDLSKNEEALIHAVYWNRMVFKEDYDIIVNLQPTSPCRLEGLLDRCLEEYDNGGYDSLLTGKKLTPFLWKKKDGNWVYPVDKHNCCDRKMRQEFLDDDKNSDFLWHDDGSIYIVETEVLLETECRIGRNPYFYEIEGINSIQIDEEYDFKLIENMAKTQNLKTLI